MPMIRIRNLSPRSFANIESFPGTNGNPFDRLLHSLDHLEGWPLPLFVLVLLILSLIGTLPAWLATHTLPPMTGVLFTFFITDWLLIAFLPITRRSFGPVKPVVLMLAVLRTLFFFLPSGWNVAAEFIGTLLLLYGFYFEPFCLDVHQETFQTGKIPAHLHLRMVHLGDLHIERTTQREEAILQSLVELKPDLILFSGDLLNLSYLADSQAQADARAFLNALSAPLGVYGVSGSPAVDLPTLFPTLVADTPLRWLDNEAAHLNFNGLPLCIYGVSCSHNPDVDNAALQKLLLASPLQAETFNILLHHSPDLAPNASRSGFDMQLSGHTHGGQIRLPFYGALVTGSLYKKAFEAGRYLVNGMTLYVSRGLGMEGAIAPRVRVHCRPELIVWDICSK